MLALNNLLSVKISRDTLIRNDWYNIFEEIVIEGFDRKYEYKITKIQKKKIELCMGSSNLTRTKKI